jgi:hypothetical protein
VFHPALSPTRGDLLAVVTRVKAAVSRWLARRHLLRDDANDAAPNPDALTACTNVAIQPGLFDKLDGAAPLRGNDPDHDEPAGHGRNSVALDGFNLHAAVAMGADDDRARERLVRYCARPPFATDRLTLLSSPGTRYTSAWVSVSTSPPHRSPCFVQKSLRQHASRQRSNWTAMVTRTTASHPTKQNGHHGRKRPQDMVPA